MTQPQTIDTRVAAYVSVKPKAPSIRARVLDYVADFNGMGVSRTEIARALDINEITAGSRLTELLQSGKVKRKGETTLSTHGKKEHLYVLGDGIPTKTQKPTTPEATLRPEQLVRILKLFKIDAYQVRRSFTWLDSPEGYNFWSAVAEQMEKPVAAS